MRDDGGLRAIFGQRLRRAQWTSVETGFTVAGVPDSEFCFPGGISGWVEHKRTSAGAVRVRPGQVAWIGRRVRLGGRVFVAVRRRTPRGDDELYLFSGAAIRPLAAGGLAAAASLQLGRWPGGPARWGWAEVESILTSEELFSLRPGRSVV